MVHRAGSTDRFTCRRHVEVELTNKKGGASSITEPLLVPLPRVAHAFQLNVRKRLAVAHALVHCVMQIGERDRGEETRLRDFAIVVGLLVIYAWGWGRSGNG